MTITEPVQVEVRKQDVDPIVGEAKNLVAACERILRRRNLSEEDFKFAFTQELHKSLHSLGIEPEVSFEKNIVNSKRADALYPSMVLEYKKPGVLSDLKAVARVEEQLGHYIRGITRGAPDRRVVGVALDGQHIVILRSAKYEPIGERKRIVQLDLEGKEIEVIADWERMGRQTVSEITMEWLLLLFRGLVKKTLSPEALVEDFDLDGEAASIMLGTLARALVTTTSPKVKMLYEEWKRLFGIVYGEQAAKHHMIVREITNKIGVTGEFNVHQILFLIHTYFALLMKMICIEVLSIQQSSILRSYATEWVTMNNEELIEDLKDLESGGIFTHLGITNFIEGDFFSWYLHAWNGEIADGIRNMSKRLANYEPATPSLEPEIVRDLLKKLYQYLVPKKIRHDLGEYYTPDWLAQLTLEEVGYDGDPNVRILDPACGSGTFLVEILYLITQRVRNYPEQYPDKDLVMKQILSNVVGFDINPIAVLAARTNFIIALSYLRARSRVRHIQIPIYLSDSILLPTKSMTPFDPDEESANYRLITSLGEPFEIPPSFADRESLSVVMDTLKDVVSYKGNREIFLERLSKTLGPSRINSNERELIRLFDQIMQLEIEGRDSIWTQIIKNNFAPIFVDNFDLVVGNPPWINWEYLSKDYRKATRDLWIQHKLLPVKSNTKKQFELGKTKRDFSMLFTYSVADLYLKQGGKMGFLITQTVFKTSGGDVFRRFQLSNKTPLGVRIVHDFVAVNPFEGASNRTSLLVLEKGKKTVYPVEYKVWNRISEAPQTDADWSEARKLLKSRTKIAAPVSRQPTDVWLTADKEALSGIRKVLGNSGFESHAGVTTWLNGAYFLEILDRESSSRLLVTNKGDVGKTKVPIKQGFVESDLIYLLVRGRDISKWVFRSSQYAIVPHLSNTGWRAISEEIMMINYPDAYKFLLQFNELLKNRSGKKQLRKNHPFYILGSIGKHTFEPYKVAWGSISDQVKAVVLEPLKDPFLGEKMPMLEHSAMFLETSSWDEAHFVCALLNSVPSQAAINCFKGIGAYGNVSRLINIPKFDPDDSIHILLSELSKEAHRKARLDNNVDTIEATINKHAMRIWDIDEPEMDGLIQELNGF